MTQDVYHHPLTPLSRPPTHPLQRDTYADNIKVFRNLLYQVRREKRVTPLAPSVAVLILYGTILTSVSAVLL